MWHSRPRDVVRAGLLALCGLAASAWSCAAGVNGGDPGDPSEAGAASEDGALANEDAAGDGGAIPPSEDAGGDDATTASDDASDDDAGSPPGDAGSDAGARDARADAPTDGGATPDTGPVDSGSRDAGPAEAGQAGQDASPLPDASVPDAADATTLLDAGCSPALLVLNEVQTSGTAGAEDEWVEIFNPESCAIDISGWEIKHTSATGTSATTVFTAPAGTVLGARSYGVVAGQSYSASAPTIGAFDTGVLADTGGGLGLYDASSVLVDAMGYGTGASNAFVQVSPAPAEGTSQSIARIPNGAKTGDNAIDFVAASPTPGAAN